MIVADDSPFICKLLTHYLESEADIKVIKTVNNGKEALRSCCILHPDVLTLDLNMPVLNGIDTLRDVMTEAPTAVILISGISKQAAVMTQQGISLGAVDFVLKYSPDGPLSPLALKLEILSKVKAAAKVKVIRSIPSFNKRIKGRSHSSTTPTRVVIIGASTGGPLALKELLGNLRVGFKFAIIIVQHMPEGFTNILAQQFDRLFPFPVRETASGEQPEPGTVLIAPGDRHLLFASDGSIQINKMDKINGNRPCIDVAMQSAAQIFGDRTAAVILSGMGVDGTQGMMAIKNNCGITFAQSAATSVVDSMPGSVVNKNLSQRVGSPEQIGHWLDQGFNLKEQLKWRN